MIDKKNDFPKGWTSAKLGEICDLVEKVRPKNRPDKNFTYIEITSIDNTRQKITKPLVYAGKDAPSRARQLVRSGDILFSTVRTYLRNIAIVDEAYDGQIASTGFCVIRPKDPINSKFIFYLVQTDSFLNPLTRIQRGTSYPAVRNSDVFAQVIPIPTLVEQHRIVFKIEELFSKLDAGVESLKNVKTQLKRYRQAVLKHAFEGKLTEEWRKTHKHEIEPASELLKRIREERKKKGKYKEFPIVDSPDLYKLPESWVWTTIGELETFIGSGITPRGGKKVYVKEGIPFIRSQNVHPDRLHLEKVAQITSQMHEAMKRTQTHPNDVLLNITGASIGRSTYIPEELVEANVNQHVCIIRTGWWIEPIYLSCFLNSIHGHDQIFTTESGMTRQALNYTQVRSLRIPLAPQSEQKFVAGKIREAFSLADEVEKVVEQSLKQSERLRQSILKNAFEGRMVPQDPTDEPAEKLLERIREEKGKFMSAEKRKKRSNRESGLKQLELVRYAK